jgi:hypothetical protein
LTIKNFNNTNGVNVFLKKELSKSLFFNDNSLNVLMTALLKDIYNQFSFKEINGYIEDMAEEIVEYYELTSPEIFNYSKDSLMMPDIASFLIYKSEKIIELFSDIKNIKFNDFKEINFIISIMFDFAKIDTEEDDNLAAVLSIYNSLLSLYDDVKTEILNL